MVASSNCFCRRGVTFGQCECDTVWGTRHGGKQGTTSGTGTITFSLSKLKPPFHLGSSDVLMIAAKFGANSVQVVN